MSTIDPSNVGTHFDSRQAEERWDRFWSEQGVHRFDEASRAETFVIDTPPPTVSGSLHVGHVFSYTQTDVLARHQRMRGRNIFYPMGWDDNGLPTERRVQNFYHVRCDPSMAYEPGLRVPMAEDAGRKQPPRKVSRRNFIDLCLALTAEDEKAFKALWQRLALSVDWSLEYSTISDHSRRIAQLSFIDLHRKGHVYGLEAPTMWDVDFRTAVAQAEVEDRPQRGAYHHIRFGVEGGASFVIATTRPELLPACVGVAAHPGDERYKPLFGRRAITPLFRAPVPVFPSELVDPTKGTGILMVCTFGDATDVAWWRERSLPLRQVLGLDGRLQHVDFGSDPFPSLDPAAANAAYALLQERSVKEAQKVIVELLRDPAASASRDGTAPLAQEPQPVEHVVKFFEKGDRPLEFMTTRQWFVRLMDRKAELVALGERMTWHPDFMRMRYRNWTENLQLDWCISRQRYFGVPFPVWYAVDATGRTDYGRPILAEESALPVDPMTDVPPGFQASQRDQPEGFRAESDVFDTWFTSSMTPQIVGGWHRDAERYRRLFPMDVRPQSHEIIRTWAFYTIAKAMLHEGTIPWRHVAISGWVLDPDRKKMSKSKGNVITPMHLLDQYGADAVRYWSLSARLGTDTAFDEKVLKVGRRLVTKLFNASKFVLQQGGPKAGITRDLDLSFLVSLEEMVRRASEAMDDFEYASALDVAERFFWSRFTDTYVEMVKARARSESDPEGRGSAVATLHLGLRVFLRLFAPFLPYVTEEAWSWGFEGGGSSIHRAPWPGRADFAALPGVEGESAVFDVAVAFLDAVHRAKGAAGATVGRHLKRLRVAASPNTASLLERALDDVLAAARVVDHGVERRGGMPEGVFEVLECDLADSRPKPEGPGVELRELVRSALDEDGAARDLTTLSTVPPEARGRGVFLAKQELVVSGVDVARAVFEAVDPGLLLEAFVEEGQRVGPRTVIGCVSGSARGLLTGERVALNFLQRLSGVASMTRRFVEAVAGTKARIRDTRKTTPLLRLLEKRAVQAGGGMPHRGGLASGVLVKDNHVRLAGGVAEATRRARAAAGGFPVEVEVESIAQVEEAIRAGADMLLLDNFGPEDVRKAVALVAGRLPVEASGGIRLESVRAFAEAGVDFIAIGALTHSAPAVDISLEIEPLP